MEAAEERIIALSHKVDAIFMLVEQLERKISAHICKESPRESNETDNLYVKLTGKNYSDLSENTLEATLEHKDILIDDDYPIVRNQHTEGVLTADNQIQRLTAQLTAAYNRIAALEEQLLSKRIH